MPLVAEIRSGMGTDEATASSDENFHLYLLVSQMKIRSRAPDKGWVTPRHRASDHGELLLYK